MHILEVMVLNVNYILFHTKKTRDTRSKKEGVHGPTGTSRIAGGCKGIPRQKSQPRAKSPRNPRDIRKHNLNLGPPKNSGCKFGTPI